jgi:plastocyanin domain-containing protein
MLATTACNEAKAEFASAPTAQAKDAAVAAPRKIEVAVDGNGFEPTAIEAKAGEPLILAFKRTSDKTCATEVVFPELKIRKPLPLGQVVEIRFTPQAHQTITFTCGMNMYKGSVVVSK